MSLYIGSDKVAPIIKMGNAVIQELEVDPSTSSQTITPSGATTGFAPVKVSAVTSAIDSNITPENIKKNIEILGVTGSYEGTSGIGIPREISVQGIYKMPSSTFTFSLPSSVANIDNYALAYALRGCISLTSVDLSSLLTIGGSKALLNAFEACVNLTSVDLSSLVTVSGPEALRFAFNGCSNLTSVDLSSLTTISSYAALFQAFNNCTRLTSLNLSSLTKISDSYTFNYAFSNCTSLTTLSFPSLNSNSFEEFTSQFDYMLLGVTDCTVHFPSNLQAVIGSWTSVLNGFNGTNTQVLFDLPATS